jgi:hypothetical protein
MKSRFVLLLALLPLAPLAAQADSREDVISGAARCAEIKDNRIWLDCYYGAAQLMRAELGLQPAPATQVNRVPLPPGVTVRPAPAPPRKGLLASIFSGPSAKAKMVSYNFDRKGVFTVTLTNGQVWEQFPNDVNFAHWKGPASDYNVSVSEGGFGRGDLLVENDGVTYRVRRAN